MNLAYIIGWLIGIMIKIYTIIFKTIFNASRIPAIKTAKWLAIKIKNEEMELIKND